MGNHPSHIIEKGGLFGGRLLCFEELESTNRWALESASDIHHGDVISAARQTRGRGRYGRQWFSASQGGLALTVFLKDDEARWMNPMVGQIIALAVREMLETYGLNALVKWPNDVLVDRQKIAGILLETRDSGKIVVAGIGLNVNVTPEMFCEAGLKTAVSMCMKIPVALSLERVRHTLLSIVEHRLNDYTREDSTTILEEWLRYDALQGSVIEIKTIEDRVRGTYAGLDGEGRLVLRIEGESSSVFTTGDVERVTWSEDRP